MNQIFITYSTALLMFFAVAGYQGYALSSLFMGGHHAGAAENHYHK